MATFQTRGPAPAASSTRIPWYVFLVNSGLPRDPGFQAYVAVQTAAPKTWLKNRAGSLVAGPFNTHAEANNWIDAKQGLKQGTNPTIAEQASNAGGFKIPNPVSWFEQATGGILAAALEQGFVQIVKDLWNVIVGPLEVLAGALVILATLAIYFKNDIQTLAPLMMA